MENKSSQISVIDETIEELPFDSVQKVRKVLWSNPKKIKRYLNQKKVTQLAKQLSWDDFSFPKRDDDNTLKKNVILEKVNNRTLAALTPQGVFQLGDIVEFESKPPKGMIGSKKRTYQNQIDKIGRSSIHISRNPTYSNTSGSGPSASTNSVDIELIKRSNLDQYRQRFTEDTDLSIPKRVNGWKLTEVNIIEDDKFDHIPTDLIHEIKWCNGEKTYVTAKWRSSYNCWYLSIPISGSVCSENVDKYIYEIDIPQQVVKTQDIIDYAIEAMEKTDPNWFQAPYDLRDSDKHDTPKRLCSKFAPMTIPEQIGDWVIKERLKNRIVWENNNEQSTWYRFTVRLNSSGKITVWNRNGGRTEHNIHDQRLVQDQASHRHKYRSRDRFDKNWFYAPAFMIDTSSNNIDSNVTDKLNDKIPIDKAITELKHEISTDHLKTKDKGKLTSYTH